MIRSLLKLLAILVIGILIYNLFLGTDEEMKAVGVAVKDLLKAEKEKFDKGKYDKAIDKIGNMLSGLKENAKEFDEKYVKRIEELERKRKELKDELDSIDENGTSEGQGDTNAIKKDSKELLQEIETLMNEMESDK
jgi:basic membrane lipoprotein Med (substrate-binding protein (PBP1-ABC) superfamily)